MISTHILDLQSGTPAPQVPVRLERRDGTTWKLVAEAPTDQDGRIAFKDELQPGTHRLIFFVRKHLEAKGTRPFFTEIPVPFEVSEPARKLHVPLLLSPYGYSTYRGS
jgi:5-hydroxyisourate hydrolase